MPRRPARSRARIGRPRSLTPELRQKIVRAIGKGTPLKDAALLAGVHRDTLRAARNDDPAFNAQIERALARWSDSVLQLIGAAVKGGDMKSARWLLEKRRPDVYGTTPEPTILFKYEHHESNMTAVLADPASAEKIDRLFAALSAAVAHGHVKPFPRDEFEHDA